MTWDLIVEFDSESLWLPWQFGGKEMCELRTKFAEAKDSERDTESIQNEMVLLFARRYSYECNSNLPRFDNDRTNYRDRLGILMDPASRQYRFQPEHLGSLGEAVQEVFNLCNKSSKENGTFKHATCIHNLSNCLYMV